MIPGLRSACGKRLPDHVLLRGEGAGGGGVTVSYIFIVSLPPPLWPFPASIEFTSLDVTLLFKAILSSSCPLMLIIPNPSALSHPISVSQSTNRYAVNVIGMNCGTKKKANCQ